MSSLVPYCQEQTVSNGRVQIQIVEVRLGDIIVEGNDAVDEEYILEQLGFAPGDFISLTTIEESLKSYNATNKSKLSTELAPGKCSMAQPIFLFRPKSLTLSGYPLFRWIIIIRACLEIVPQSFSATFNNLVNRDDEVNVSVSMGWDICLYHWLFHAPWPARRAIWALIWRPRKPNPLLRMPNWSAIAAHLFFGGRLFLSAIFCHKLVRIFFCFFRAREK